MAGAMVSGASPIYAGIYQFIIVAMILAASGIAGLIVTLLMRARAFSVAAQMTLRPGERQQTADRLARFALLSRLRFSQPDGSRP
jgi:putative ABC transport system permease protein